MIIEKVRQNQQAIEEQIRARGVRDPLVLAAMLKVPRHLFVPEAGRAFAYSDEPLPIGEEQTISQPYIVGYMTEALGLRGGERVLEVGTGSGYQTAVLAEVAGEVWTIELIESLSLRARAILRELGYRNVRFAVGDGALGQPDAAPFDGIMVTAAAPGTPDVLESQLGPSGVMIVPVGVESQELILVRREAQGLRRERLIPVRFVPLVKGPSRSG